MMLPTHRARRTALLAALAAGLTLASQTCQATATLPLAVSLPDELARALKTGNPLVVMVSLEGCPFCKVARENYLGPMQAQQGLPVVQVDMHSKQAVKTFRGLAATHESLIGEWGVKVAPTVLFFGPTGVELAERLVGGSLSDFYGAYLDGRIDQARKKAALRVP